MAVGNQILSRNPQIIVIGAGPAGTASAICCAKYGFDVTLLEIGPSTRIIPGETLHPGVEPVFKKLGIYNDIQKANFLRYPGIRIKWNKENHPKVRLYGGDQNGHWLGYQVPRSSLNEILRCQALRDGVKICRPCRALDTITSVRRVIGLKTSSSNNEILADYVIDASGGTHWLARKLKIEIKKYSPVLFAQFGYVQGECSVLDQMPMMESIVDGWIYMAKVEEGIYQWTMLNFKKKLVSYDWLPEKFRGMKLYQPTNGSDVTWRKVLYPSGPGYFILGDAAMVVDPASSNGVLRALISGIQVSQLVYSIYKNKIHDKLALSVYNRWMSQWFLYDIKNLALLYNQHQNSPGWLQNKSQKSSVESSPNTHNYKQDFI